jgi:hypothetical protein
VNGKGLHHKKIGSCFGVWAVTACCGALASTAPGWFDGLATQPPPTPDTWILPGEGALESAPCTVPGTLASGAVQAMDLRDAIERALCHQPTL